MALRRCTLPLTLAFLVGFAACQRKAALQAAEARADLDQVCQTQKSFVQTRKLMKTVAVAELLHERDAQLAKTVKTLLVKEALAEAQRAPAGSRRKSLDLAARRAGAKDWACPELETF